LARAAEQSAPPTGVLKPQYAAKWLADNFRVADHPAFWIMKPKKKSWGRLLINVLHLEVRFVSMASA
jgi:hypothetical protein